ncbi:MAG: cation:proton antiporter [Synechocystis sp.]
MAGMELDLLEIKGPPLSLAVKGWGLSLIFGTVCIAPLHFLPYLKTPLLVILTLCTTGLGVLVPLLRDSGQLSTLFGRLVMAAGTIGEVAPIILISLLLSPKYNTWQEIGFLLIFLCLFSGVFAIGIGFRPPRLLRFLGKHLRSSTQLPVRFSLLIIAILGITAETFGFERIFGAFAAGMILGQATRGDDGLVLREKIEAICFGWFYPFFFVGTGIKFDVPALTQNIRIILMIPLFLLLFFIIRGGSVFLYSHGLERSQKFAFALFVAVPSISLLVVITQIGLETKMINNDIATALISAALLAVLLFPTLAQALLSRLDSSPTE